MDNSDVLVYGASFTNQGSRDKRVQIVVLRITRPTTEYSIV